VRRPLLLLILACLPRLGGILYGQVDYSMATLRGTVVDPQDRVVSGATVTAIDSATGAVKNAVTSNEGYRFPALAPGKYRVETEASGFARSVITDLELTVGQTATYDIHLEVGSQTT